VDVQSYLQNEVKPEPRETKAAEEMLAMGNTLLQQGEPQQARRAFQSAYGLSTHDDAFNEDARVTASQLEASTSPRRLERPPGCRGGRNRCRVRQVPDLRDRKALLTHNRKAKQIIDALPADDNEALMRLAERLDPAAGRRRFQPGRHPRGHPAARPPPDLPPSRPSRHVRGFEDFTPSHCFAERALRRPAHDSCDSLFRFMFLAWAASALRKPPDTLGSSHPTVVP